MGTDRHDEFSGPCACGKGEFVVEHCEKDHGWPTATPVWHTARIDCPECAKAYELDKRGRQFVLLRKEDVQAYEARRAAAWQAREELMAQPEVVALLSELAEHLDNLPSTAERYRVLAARDWIYTSLGPFRKRWTGGAAWVRAHVNPDMLLEACRLTEQNPEAIEQLLAEYHAVSQGAHDQPPPVGEPIYTFCADS